LDEPKQNATWISVGSCTFDHDLTDFGRRIAGLLESKKTQQYDYAVATLDDLLGAVHALIMALHNDPPFVNRPRGKKIEIQPLLDRAKGIAEEHRVRMGGAWMAGCHFNSAISRLSFVYHRSLKIVTGQLKDRKQVGWEDDQTSLIYTAKKIYKGWTGVEWDNENIRDVHKEVNELKHDAKGIYWGRDVDEAEAVQAIKELLNLLEAWNSQACTIP